MTGYGRATHRIRTAPGLDGRVRVSQIWSSGQGERWQSVPWITEQTETPWSKRMHARPGGQPRASQVGRQEGPSGPPSRGQKNPSGQLSGTSG